jgi:aldose 1-epimerase
MTTGTRQGPHIARSPFGRTADGREIERFDLVGAGGVEVSVIGLGGVIQSLRAPDREGRLADVVLGYDDLAGYQGDTSAHGILVGRFANRIRNGAFTLDGKEHQLPRNDGPHHLHGGERGFGKRVWAAEPFRAGTRSGWSSTTSAPTGRRGTPGR